MRNGIAKRFSHSRVGARWSYGIILPVVCAAIIGIGAQSYRAIDRELTAAALSRRAFTSDLAAATLSEKIEHLISATVSRALASLI